MHVEVFLADCPLCQRTLQALYDTVPPTAEVTVHRCRGPFCCEAGKRYDLYMVLPAVVLDGKLVRQGSLTPERANRLFESAAERPPLGKPQLIPNSTMKGEL